MKSLKQSLVAAVGHLAVLGALALFAPIDNLGQKPSPVPPAVSVKVINTPSEPVPVTGTVNVGNLGTGPLIVRDADNPVLQPYKDSTVITIPVDDMSVSSTFTSVPAGKLLVIEYINVRAHLQPDQVLLIDFMGYMMPLTSQGLLDARRFFAASERVRLYVTADDEIRFFANRSAESSTASVRVSFSGYLVDRP